MTSTFVPTGDAIRKSLDGTKAGAGAMSQSVGIEWMDYLKQVSSDVTATAEKVVKAGSPAKAMEIQGAFVKASGEHFLARAATFRDLYATLAQDMVQPFTALAERKAA